MDEEANAEPAAGGQPTSTEVQGPSRDEGQQELARLAPSIDMDAEPVANGQDDEMPVRPHLRDDAGRDLGVSMGLPPLDDGNVRLCRNAILLSLNEALLLGVRRVFYSRDRNYYSQPKIALPPWWTYANAIHAVRTMAGKPDILIHHRASPQSPRASDFSRRRSSFEAGERFPVPSEPLPVQGAAVPSDRVILRDKRGRAKSVKRSEFVTETCLFLGRYDDQIGKAELTIDHPDIRWLSTSVGFVPSSGRLTRIDLSRRHLVRVFNGNLSSGGRFYRVFWAEMRKHLRPHLRINGEPVAEHDFAACHLRLAYYALGVPCEADNWRDRDHYALRGIDNSWRKTVKLGVQILLNAKSLRQARGALAAGIDATTWDTSLDMAEALIAAIKEAHPALAPIWHSGCGLGLQFVDSEIVKSCLEQLMDRGIIGLPVHDAIIVPASQHHALVEIMETTFSTLGPQLAPAAVANLRSKPGFCGRDLTKGSCAAPSRPLLDDRSSSTSVALRASTEVDLTLLDLARLVEARGGWTAPLLRCVLVLLRQASGSPGIEATCFMQWLDAIGGLNCPEPVRPMIDAALEPQLARRGRPPSPAAVARACKVSASEAASLGLLVVRPPPRDHRSASAGKRSRRMLSGVAPRVVSVDAAKPWIDAGMSRSSWYAHFANPIERQVLAARAIVAAGNMQAIDDVRNGVSELRRQLGVRGAASASPAAQLLRRLEGVLHTVTASGATASWGRPPSFVQFASWGAVALEPAEGHIR